MTHADISGPTSSAALAALAEALAVNPVLSVLKLGGNNLGSDGAAILGTAILDASSVLSV